MAQRCSASGGGARPTRPRRAGRVAIGLALVLAAGACGRGGGDARDPVAAGTGPGAETTPTGPVAPAGSDPAATPVPGSGAAADGTRAGTTAIPAPDPDASPGDAGAASAPTGASVDAGGAATAAGAAAAPPSTTSAPSGAAAGVGTGGVSPGGAGHPGGQAGEPTTTSTEPPTTGTLTGTVYAGPDCNEVNHSNCPPLTNGSVSITGPDLGPDGRPVPTDGAGRFSVSLPPGSYRLDVAESCSGSTRPVEVEAGGTVTATLWCSGGAI